ncbi:MAG: hypothetical protein KKH28_14260 [Elusimicrobia bacterium]|nr:hypothetical protein [Elusimicrobiota bacterium]
MFKIFAYLVLILSAAYGAITVYPGMFFSSSHDYKNIAVYSHEPLKEGANGLLGQVSEKISAGEFFDAGQKFEVYLAGGYGEYALFTLFCRKDYACLHPLTGKLFLASADFEKKRSYISGDESKGRPLDAVLTRGLAKAQVREKMGGLTYFFLGEWKTEGYAEHVAGETEGWDPAEICREKAANDPVLRHLKYRLIVELVSNEDRMGYPVLMKENYSYEGVEKRVKKRYCGNN